MTTWITFRGPKGRTRFIHRGEWELRRGLIEQGALLERLRAKSASRPTDADLVNFYLCSRERWNLKASPEDPVEWQRDHLERCRRYLKTISTRRDKYRQMSAGLGKKHRLNLERVRLLDEILTLGAWPREESARRTMLNQRLVPHLRSEAAFLVLAARVDFLIRYDIPLTDEFVRRNRFDVQAREALAVRIEAAGRYEVMGQRREVLCAFLGLQSRNLSRLRRQAKEIAAEDRKRVHAFERSLTSRDLNAEALLAMQSDARAPA
jgi:hypothetical protein